MRIYATARTVDNDLTKVIRRVFTAWLAAVGNTTGSKPLLYIAWTKRKISNRKQKLQRVKAHLNHINFAGTVGRAITMGNSKNFNITNRPITMGNCLRNVASARA